MSKALKIYKIISNVLLLICSAFFAYIAVSLTIKHGGLALLLSIMIYIPCGAPVVLYAIIYNIVMGIIKKYSVFDGITLVLLILAYASLLLAPIIVNAVTN